MQTVTILDKVKKELLKSPDLYIQTIGWYSYKIYKEAKKFTGLQYPDQDKLFDFFHAGIQAAIEARTEIQKAVNKRKINPNIFNNLEQLRRIFPSYILPKCKAAMLKEKNIYLPLSLPRTCSLDYAKREAKRKGKTLADYLEIPTRERGLFSIDEQPNVRQFYILRQAFLSGNFQKKYSDLILTEIENDEEDILEDRDIHTLTVYTQDILGSQNFTVTYPATPEFQKTLLTLTPEERFIVVAIFFEEYPPAFIASLIMHIYGDNGSNPETQLKEKINTIYNKLRGILTNEN